jgi:glycosyltransferase involved in cell wall biosynthesis
VTKLAYICSSTSWGGLEMNQWRNAFWMQERGYEVLIFALKDSPIYKKAESSNIPVIAIKKHRKYYDFGASFQLIKLLKKEGISHLIVRDTRDMSIAAMTKFWSFGFHFHLSYFMEMQLGVKKTNWLHTLRFSQFDLWSCPLAWLQSQVLSKTRFDFNKTIIIPSALDLSPFQSVSKNNENQIVARNLLDLPANKTIVGLIGRFDPQKGQVLLLEALNSCINKEVCVCLLGEPTLGEGTTYYERIEKTIEDYQLQERVFIRPFREDIASFYKAIDAFVMASKAETFGMVTIEAMASGVPTIGSNAGGTPEILEYGKLGFLFEPLDALSLARSIDEFLNNRDLISPNLLMETAKKYDQQLVCAAVESAMNLQ